MLSLKEAGSAPGNTVFALSPIGAAISGNALENTALAESMRLALSIPVAKVSVRARHDAVSSESGPVFASECGIISAMGVMPCVNAAVGDIEVSVMPDAKAVLSAAPD